MQQCLTKKPINRTGRRGKWGEDLVEAAYVYCLEHGGTNKELAHQLGIGRRTFDTYRQRYRRFSDAIKKGRKFWRDNGGGNIVPSLFQRAEGYTRKVVTVTRKETWDSERKRMVLSEVIIEIETVYHPGDQRAVEFILTRYDSENWKPLSWYRRPKTRKPPAPDA